MGTTVRAFPEVADPETPATAPDGGGRGGRTALRNPELAAAYPERASRTPPAARPDAERRPDWGRAS